MITKIHSTTILVSDQDAALDFYVNILGFEKAMDSPMGPGMRWLTIVPPGAQTQIALAVASWFNHPGMEMTPPSTTTGISLTAENIDATYETLVSRGVKFKGPVEVMPWGSKAAWFYDPDGNEFFLAEE